MRSGGLEEIKEAASLLEKRDVPCSVDRETGIGHAEFTEHLVVEDTHCWTVSVPQEYADFASEILDERGFESMADPDLLISPLSKSETSFVRVLMYGWLTLIGLLVVFVILDIVGVIDMASFF